jgi:hypothetical protein
MKVYVASSWRNELQPAVVSILRDKGHEVYDFRNPHPGNTGFHWSDIDDNWKQWTMSEYREVLKQNPMATKGFEADKFGLLWADFVLLVQPCGASSHLELGWAAGAGKLTGVLLNNAEPELMYRLADHLFVNLHEVCEYLRHKEALV